MSAKRGLPSTLKSRQDLHYVDSLVFREGEIVGRMIALSEIQPNPGQPRKLMGDLEHLAQSISEHGVLEPLLVIKKGSGFQIVSGERRYLAAKAAGLDLVPCIVKNLDAPQLLEVALVENLQRKDLHPFEEADGLKTLSEKYQYTHEQIAAKIGKARSSVTETLTIAGLSPRVRQAALDAEISAKSLLLSVAKLAPEEAQLALIEKISRGASRQQARDAAKKQTRAKPFVFRFKDPEKRFSVDLKFKKSKITRDELIETLQAILHQVKEESW